MGTKQRKSGDSPGPKHPHGPPTHWPFIGMNCTGDLRLESTPGQRLCLMFSSSDAHTQPLLQLSIIGVAAQALIFVKSLGNPWKEKVEYYYEIIAFYSAPSESCGSLFGPTLSKPRVKTWLAGLWEAILHGGGEADFWGSQEQGVFATYSDSNKQL